MKIYLQLGDLGEDVEAEIEYSYTASTPDVYYLPNGDPGYPGDPEEIEITSFQLFEKDFDFDLLTEDAKERIYTQISEYERS